MASDKKNELLQQLQNEKSSIDPAYVNATKLLNEEIERVQSGREKDKFVEIHHGKPMKLAVKILIPIKQFPKFNFVGKLLGPNGNSLKRLQAETLTKMAILGRGSMRDKNKEEELRKEGGKYSHLNQELHVCVEAFATPLECHQRIAHALSELQMFLSPFPEQDGNDDIRAQQLEEMMYLNGDKPGGPSGGHTGGPSGPPRGRGRGRGAAPPPPSRGGRGGATPSALLATPGLRSGAPPARPHRGMGRAAPVRGAAPPGRGAMAPRPPPAAGRPAARPVAMETGYDQDPYYQQQSSSGYGDDGYGAYEETDYQDNYSQGYSQQAQETEFYDYGHGASTEDAYGDYGDGWSQATTGYGKAPVSRPRTGGVAERSHPYGGAGSRQARF